MNKTVKIAILLTIAILLIIPNLINAADKEEKPYWWSVHYKIDADKMDDFIKLTKDYTFPIVEKAKEQGKVLDFKVLLHEVGTEYNVVIMQKSPSWCDLKSNWYFEILEEMITDKEELKKFYKEFDRVYCGFIHYDEILIELTPQF